MLVRVPTLYVPRYPTPPLSFPGVSVAILKVAQMGHPVLRRVAEPVDPAAIRTPAFRRVCQDLLDTMDEYDGAGLAAPQVHLSVRVVVLTLDGSEGPEVWVNPVLTPLTDRTSATYEGCLSVEGMRGRVARPARIHVRFLDDEGAERAYVLQGFPAVVAQHECDHLDGVLYIDKADPRTLAFLPEFRKFGRMDEYEDAPPEDLDDEPELGDAVIEVPADLSAAEALALAEPHLLSSEEE